MKSIVFLLTSFIFLISCEEMPETDSTKANPVSERTAIIDTVDENITIEKIVPNKDFEEQKNIAEKENYFVAECKFGDIHINIEEKQNKIYVSSNDEVVEDFSIAIKGKVDRIIETDVNADGFNEFYCVTTTGDLIAYASYKNKSFGEIYVPQKPLSFYKDINGLKFWEVKNDKLLLTFSNGENSQLNVVRYHLKSGETGFKLIAE